MSVNTTDMSKLLKGKEGVKEAITEEKFELGEVGDLEIKTGSTEAPEIKDVEVKAPKPKRARKKKGE